LADKPVWTHRSRTPRLLVVVGATLRYWSRTPGLAMGDAATSRHGSRMPRWLEEFNAADLCLIAATEKSLMPQCSTLCSCLRKEESVQSTRRRRRSTLTYPLAIESPIGFL
ncbi:hypothetical protein B296_00058043, partial [Ensete ventricosum]